MKNFKTLFSFAIATILFSSCSSSDDSHPVNEEELITNVSIVFNSTTSQDQVILTFEDLDGDGPNAPVYNSTGSFDVNQIYDAQISVSNPQENITEEILEEADDHQFFYFATDGFLADFEYKDLDNSDLPIGLEFQLKPSNISQDGKFSLILRHLPNKSGVGVSQGNISNAGGSTDLNIQFPVTVR